MKSKKILLTAGAVILTAASVLAGVNKFFSTNAYVRVGSGTGNCLLLTSARITNFATTGTFQAAIRTVGGTQETVWSTSGCTTNKLYFTN